MARKLFAFFLLCTMLIPLSVSAKEPFVVIIDAGHGGGDVGTPHRKGRLDEKTIALNVSLKLGQIIKDNHPDVKVVYTRTSDVYPTLPDRTQIARKAKGNLLISIHVNAAENTSARGFETYVFGITGLAGKSAAEQARIKQRTMIERENLDINGKQIDFEKTVDMQTKILCQTQREKHNIYSKEFANLVQKSLINGLNRSTYRGNVNDRGVKEKNIYVLCYSPMPAILVELGYMSNVTEERFINTLEAQNLFATSLYDAFAVYKQNWEKRQLDYAEGEETAMAEGAGSETAAASGKDDNSGLKDVKLRPTPTEEKQKAESEKLKAEEEEKLKAESRKQKEEAEKAEREKLKAESEAKAKAEAEAKAKAEAEAKAKAEAEAKAKAEAEAKAAAEKAAAEAKLAKEKADAEAKQKAEAEEKLKAESRKQKEEAEAKAKAEAEAKQKAESEKLKAESEAKAKAESEKPKAESGKPYYRVQFLVSPKKLEKGDAKLKGLWPVEVYQDGNMYKYTIGNSTDRSTLQATYKEVKALFPDAFWVKFDAEGHRIK